MFPFVNLRAVMNGHLPSIRLYRIELILIKPKNNTLLSARQQFATTKLSPALVLALVATAHRTQAHDAIAEAREGAGFGDGGKRVAVAGDGNLVF
jgi:hypothetical protein